MHKLTKQILTGVVALGLLAPVATQAISNNSQTTVNAKRKHHNHRRIRRVHSTWHYGVPKAIKGMWRSKIFNSGHGIYRRSLVKVGANHLGFNPSGYLYNKHHHYQGPYAQNGSFWDPHYRYLGHKKYEIKSGGSEAPIKYIIKRNNSHHMSAWVRYRHHMNLQGHYNKAYSKRAWLRK